MMYAGKVLTHRSLLLRLGPDMARKRIIWRLRAAITPKVEVEPSRAALYCDRAGDWLCLSFNRLR